MSATKKFRASANPLWAYAKMYHDTTRAPKIRAQGNNSIFLMARRSLRKSKKGIMVKTGKLKPGGPLVKQARATKR